MKRALPFVLLAMLAGCSLGSDEETEPVSGDARRVATTIGRLDAATRAKRFDFICDRLFTQAARKRAGGGNCAKLLTATAKDVRRPRISLVSISLEEKGRAEARVRTVAVGQEPIEETIHLQRERGAFRIEALG